MRGKYHRNRPALKGTINFHLKCKSSTPEGAKAREAKARRSKTTFIANGEVTLFSFSNLTFHSKNPHKRLESLSIIEKQVGMAFKKGFSKASMLLLPYSADLQLHRSKTHGATHKIQKFR